MKNKKKIEAALQDVAEALGQGRQWHEIENTLTTSRKYDQVHLAYAGLMLTEMLSKEVLAKVGFSKSSVDKLFEKCEGFTLKERNDLITENKEYIQLKVSRFLYSKELPNTVDEPKDFLEVNSGDNAGGDKQIQKMNVSPQTDNLGNVQFNPNRKLSGPVIEWRDPDPDAIIWRYPEDTVEWNSTVLVREFEQVLFMKDGKMFDIFS